MKALFSAPPTHPTRRWWTRTLIANALIGLVALGAIQLVPIRRDNPPVQREPVWDSAETHLLVMDACYDCHSNATDWPWYASIAPISWVIRYDVTEGRQRLNFSEWDRFATADSVDPNDPFPPKTLSERIADAVRSGRMPPGTYRLMNPGARLTDAEQEALIAGLVRTVQQNQDAQ